MVPGKRLYVMLFEKSGHAGSVSVVSVVVSEVVVTVVVSDVVVTEVLSVVLSEGSVPQDAADAHKQAVSNKLTAFLTARFL